MSAFKPEPLVRPRTATGGIPCAVCVYFSRNLEKTEYPVLMEKHEGCGLGFLPGDQACTEMRTDNCSVRKSL